MFNFTSFIFLKIGVNIALTQTHAFEYYTCTQGQKIYSNAKSLETSFTKKPADKGGGCTLSQSNIEKEKFGVRGQRKQKTQKECLEK